MAKLTGFSKVASVTFPRGYCGTFYFALYEDGYVPGDKVVVSGTGYGQIAEIKEIITSEEAAERWKKNITEEVICKIDTSSYDRRVENRKAAEQLKREMDKMIKQMEETDKYEMFAERNQELADMLDKYRELIKSGKV